MQPELQAYFQEVARKHELYPLIQFNADLRAAHWDEAGKVWRVQVSTGDEYTARYLVTGMGILHKPYLPEIPGLDTFKGRITHSSQWKPDIEWKGKNVAVFGTGASGVQLVGELAGEAKTLTNFIRHAQYVIPAAYRKVSADERKGINDSYDDIWNTVFSSAIGMGFDEPQRATLSVSPDEREAIFEDLWKKGSGFRFLFGGFNDLTFDEAANKEAINFIHRKIKETVKDPQKAAVLTSNDWFARRPLTDDRYYERFNQDNVFAVDIKDNPVTHATPEGLVTADGNLHPFDLIVFATGFDSVDGSYFRVDFKGRDGKTLPEHWADGPKTHTGAQTSGFPNLFFVNGPGVPFSNQPPVAEEIANFNADIIQHSEDLRKRGQTSGVVENTPESEEYYLDEMRKVGSMSLFSKTPSWFFGENIPGRKKSPRFYFGGFAGYKKYIEESKRNGYAGFVFT
jgi:cation diffusion facilitator CzcD-associated flavoprotein CzcO